MSDHSQRSSMISSGKAAPPKTPTAALLVLITTFTAALAFMAGVLFSEITASKHNDDDFEIFWRSWDILERDFYFDLPDDPVLIQGAIQGLLATVNDPFTYLAPPDRAELDRQQTQGEFGGIGAEIERMNDSRYRVTAVYPDLPAEQAGLQAGDIVHTIDGVTAATLDQSEFLAAIRGDTGTSVALSVQRPSTDEELDLIIQRTRIELPTAYSERYEDTGYVRLVVFNENAAKALEDEIQALLDSGVTSLILDLRQNPGGLLDQAVQVSDLFLDSGTVVKQRSRGSGETVLQSEDGDLAEDLPLVVLIDERSASASEVVAGAIQDRKRAVLIGANTYGKGSVQHIYDMEDDSQLHVTVSIWLTPNETPIQEAGLTPDIRVDTSILPESGMDPYIDAGLQYFDTLSTREAIEDEQYEGEE